MESLVFGVVLLVSLSAALSLKPSRPGLCHSSSQSSCSSNGDYSRPCPRGEECRNGRCCNIIITLPQFCPSGQVGPSCSFGNPPCKPGYTCLLNNCCRDRVCPIGSSEGGSCNLLPGQQRCRFGYNCINNFCCKQDIIITPPSSCLSPGPICRRQGQCKSGYTCVKGRCCPRGGSSCPVGWVPGRRCGRHSNGPQCPGMATCINNTCCTQFILPIDRCPNYVLPRIPGLCPSYGKRDQCRTNKDCKRGKPCCPDKCGRRVCFRKSRRGGRD